MEKTNNQGTMVYSRMPKLNTKKNFTFEAPRESTTMVDPSLHMSTSIPKNLKSPKISELPIALKNINSILGSSYHL